MTLPEMKSQLTFLVVAQLLQVLVHNPDQFLRLARLRVPLQHHDPRLHLHQHPNPTLALSWKLVDLSLDLYRSCQTVAVQQRIQSSKPQPATPDPITHWPQRQSVQ